MSNANQSNTNNGKTMMSKICVTLMPHSRAISQCPKASPLVNLIPSVDAILSMDEERVK